MEVQASRQSNVVCIAPTGRIDHSNAEAFAEAVKKHLDGCAQDGHAILFDLERLEYISSAGLRVFMLAAKACNPAGGRLAIARPRPLVGEILKISRFHHVLPVHADFSEALASLETSQTQAGK